jgi:hypothetical protein
MSWFSAIPPPSPPTVDFGGALLSSFFLTTAIAALGVIFFVRWSTQNYVAKLKAAHQAEIEKLRAQLDTPHARGEVRGIDAMNNALWRMGALKHRPPSFKYFDPPRRQAVVPQDRQVWRVAAHVALHPHALRRAAQVVEHLEGRRRRPLARQLARIQRSVSHLVQPSRRRGDEHDHVHRLQPVRAAQFWRNSLRNSGAILCAIL